MRITRQTAHALVTRALDERRRELDESVDQIRTLENERLDKMTRLMFKRLDDPTNPDPEKTVMAILRISDRRAKMNGTDAPTDFRITPGGSNVIPVGGDIDVSKLSDDQLRELEELTSRYETLKLAAPASVQQPDEYPADEPHLPDGGPVAVVDAPR